MSKKMRVEIEVSQGDGRWDHTGEPVVSVDGESEVIEIIKSLVVLGEEWRYDYRWREVGGEWTVVDGKSITKRVERCDCCNRILDPAKIVLLELSWETNTWHQPGTIDEDISQGCFPFGPACAKKALKGTARKRKR